MAGPYANLRLADLGARVIKIERPIVGDRARRTVTKSMKADDDSILFHTVNRNKESFEANLENAEDLDTVKKLCNKVDVITHCFHRETIERLGLDYQTLSKLNPGVIYAEISGYGSDGPWQDKPNQDLFVQSLSGLTWLTGNQDDHPTPFGAAVADMVTGSNLVHAILSALIRKRRTGKGAKVEVSLMESIIDFQFEGLTTYLNIDNSAPQRSKIANAHAYLGAPYGIYTTSDNYIAVAMGDITVLADALGMQQLKQYAKNNRYYLERDQVKQLIADQLKSNTTEYWLRALRQRQYWCSEVLNYNQLVETEGYKAIDMEMTTSREDGVQLVTTRCPIRLNGHKIKSTRAAPILGSANESVLKEFEL